jgi:pimeloyl-ACP methyl ester carboxylesterase
MRVFLAILFLLIFNFSFSQVTHVSIENTNSFFLDDEVIKNENIEWKYIKVPENWKIPDGKKIKLAVAIIKSNAKNPGTVLYLEGGPGAGGIASIYNWINNPIRNNNNIVLVDIRGTGNSLPRLCPDLGKVFLEILAQDQTPAIVQQSKIYETISCKEDMIDRGIDLHQYNSYSVANDLHALKLSLNIEKWIIFGVSYGTYQAQLYANEFPKDVQALILDSVISDISKYYNRNTTNYQNSIQKVFDDCENDPACNEKFPELENLYYKTIEKISKDPITVQVDKNLVSTGIFTYNVDDFKLAIQQALYDEQLIKIVPLLIREFHNENRSALGELVAAFSGALNLDYGLYYCMTCNEVLPYNSSIEFDNDANEYRNLKGGLLFYKTDFKVCDYWNLDKSIRGEKPVFLNLYESSIPTLIFAGGYDPITPVRNGEELHGKLKNSLFLVNQNAGHVPSFSNEGMDIVTSFIFDPNVKPNLKFGESKSKAFFVTDVKINQGVIKLATSLGKYDFLFFIPLAIALLVLLINTIKYCYNICFGESISKTKLYAIFIIVLSFLAWYTVLSLIVAVHGVAQNNTYLLIFGLPSAYGYLFVFQWLYFILFLFLIIYFLFGIKNREVADYAILFSFILIVIYFQYWGFYF